MSLTLVTTQLSSLALKQLRLSASGISSFTWMGKLSPHIIQCTAKRSDDWIKRNFRARPDASGRRASVPVTPLMSTWRWAEQQPGIRMMIGWTACQYPFLIDSKISESAILLPRLPARRRLVCADWTSQSCSALLRAAAHCCVCFLGGWNERANMFIISFPSLFALRRGCFLGGWNRQANIFQTSLPLRYGGRRYHVTVTLITVITTP